MATAGGPAIKVSLPTGGERAGGPALPVAVVSDGRAVQGGPAVAGYLVTSGPVLGGPAIPVVAAAAGSPVVGGPAIPLYVVSGVLGATAPANTALPTISGTTELGQTLTATTGTWSNSPTSYAYQWYRGGVTIGGATSSTYVLQAADAGTTITVTVTATNAAGSASATSAGTAIPNWLLLDRFTTDAVAPLASPRTCEPGPGTLTLVQTDGSFATSGGQLVVTAQSSSVWGDLSLVGASQARSAGRALLATVQNWTDTFGWIGFNNDATPADSATAGVDAIRTDQTPRLLNAVTNGTTIITGLQFALSTTYQIAVVHRAAGCFHFVSGGAFGTFPTMTLIWVGNAGTGAGFPALSYHSQRGNVDDFRVIDLGGSFATSTGIATAVSATPSNPTALTGTADGLIEFSWTVATGETLELDVRRTDADNRWIVRCDQGGSTIKLIERNATIETERASAAQTWTNGVQFRIVVLMQGTLIKTFVANAARASYSSATFNQAATGVNVAGFATGAGLIAWPGTVTLPAVS